MQLDDRTKQLPISAVSVQTFKLGVPTANRNSFISFLRGFCSSIALLDPRWSPTGAMAACNERDGHYVYVHVGITDYDKVN